MDPFTQLHLGSNYLTAAGVASVAPALRRPWGDGGGLRQLSVSDNRLGDAEHRLVLVRPMLRTRRTTIESLIERFGEEPYHDSTNDDVRHARNELRHRTIPSLVRSGG